MCRTKYHLIKDYYSPAGGFVKDRGAAGGDACYRPELFRIHTRQRCTSALDLAWSMTEQGRMDPGDSVLCQEQTLGRGRMKRAWVSPPGNLYAAWVVPPFVSIMPDRLLPLILGLCIRRSLLNFGVSVALKWPNDLVYNDLKIGGMLLEEKNSIILAGLGINLSSAPQEDLLRKQSALRAGHLGYDPEALELTGFWARLLVWIYFWYSEIMCNYSLIDFIHEIKSNLWLIDQEAVLEAPQETCRGIFSGISEDGSLLMQTSQGTRKFESGSLYRAV